MNPTEKSFPWQTPTSDVSNEDVHSRKAQPAKEKDSTANLSGPALCIVATPIGNLEDITFRAISVLKKADILYCEDTRKTAILCNHYGIQTPRKSFRVHRLQEDINHALDALERGLLVALVSDAGTPGISDPGSDLVRQLRTRSPEIPIFPIPGASALAAALSVSGYRANPSVFGGFLSPKAGKRKKALQQLQDFAGPCILYESVHRIRKLIYAISETLPDREILIFRELTRLFEQTIFIPAGLDDTEIDKILATMPEKGEFTVVIGPASSS